MTWRRTAAAAVAIAAATALAGCATSSGLHTSNPAKTKARIEAAVPIGATAETAFKTMAREGYTCAYSRQGNIRCRLEANLPGDVFSTSWIANFSIVDGHVTGMNTGQGLREL